MYIPVNSLHGYQLYRILSLIFFTGRLHSECGELERSETCNSLITGTLSFSFYLTHKSLSLNKKPLSIAVKNLLCGWIRLQLSVYRGSGGVQALMSGNARKLAEKDESTLMASGIPYTIIRAGVLQNTPGAKQGFKFEEVLSIIHNPNWLFQTYK